MYKCVKCVNLCCVRYRVDVYCGNNVTSEEDLVLPQQVVQVIRVVVFLLFVDISQRAPAGARVCRAVRIVAIRAFFSCVSS